MIFCLALLRAGFVPALVVFFLWSLPGAVGMYALSLGVQRLGQTLPPIAYATLSGLNASTVGIICLAAVQLAGNAIRDKLTRIILIIGACAGLCYNALWFFPSLMALGGLTTVIWDGWLGSRFRRVLAKWNRRKQKADTADAETAEPVSLGEREENQNGLQRRVPPTRQTSTSTSLPASESADRSTPHSLPEIGDSQAPPRATEENKDHAIRVRIGVAIVAVVFASFIAFMVARATLDFPPLALSLFTNMYLAGIIIFGGGPVVIPLLRSYVVDPGWVSSRDFLLGLAMIQAFPGPNFNFAVYLGALALRNASVPTIFGSLLGFVGIFFPGIALAMAMQSFWRVLRTKRWVVDLLRGVNAAAVGLVFTAVYRLWEIGYLTPDATGGQSLALEPWWVVVSAVTYAGSAWFNVPTVLAIIMGAVLGLCWYGVVAN